MPVIISVHGTNDSGPESGQQWWQTGSMFAQDLEALVEGEQGETVRLQPFIWDGKNSETSRRSAGKALHRELAKLEAEDEPYCLVGHSHGGSVIGHALLECGLRRHDLKSLSAWFTVGTPFVQFDRQSSIFARLNLIGRAAYVMALTLALVPLAYLAVKIVVSGDSGVFMDLGDTIVQFGLPFGLFLLMTFIVERMESRRYRAALLRNVGESFNARWRPLNHEDDEAIQGLIATGSLKGRIFGDHILIALLQMTILAAAIVFVAGGMLASQGDAVEALPFLDWPVFAFSRALLFGPYQLAAQTIDFSSWPPALSDAFMEVLMIGLAPAILYFLVVLAAFVITYLPFAALSASGAGSLSASAWRQIRQLAFGGDCLGEVATGAKAAPAWSAAQVPTLPVELSERLETKANEAAARAIAKFRAALSSFAYSVAEPSHRDFVADYVTWQELIHTSYFRDSLFRKLVCHMIGQQPGFRAKGTLRRDEQVELLEKWHRVLAQPLTPASG